MADSRIFNGYANSVKSAEDYASERQMLEAKKQALQANALEMTAKQQGTDRANAFRDLAMTLPTDPVERVRALRTANTPEAWQAADSLEKSQNDIGESRAKAGKLEADTKGSDLENKIKTHNFSLQRLQTINDPVSAHAWAAEELKSGNVTPDQYLAGISKIPSEPQAFQAWKQQAMMGGVSALDNLKIENENRRNAANNATSRANNASSNAVSMRGQNMVDARARDEFGRGGKAPAGYRWNQSGELEAVPGGPGAARAAEVDYKREERDNARSAKRDAVGAQIAVIDKALNHPGRETATGLSGKISPTNYIPGTDAKDFQVVLDQIGGATFLQAFESLKGGGQITEVEGKKATDAIARLSRSQSDAEFKQSLQELRVVMKQGQDRLLRSGVRQAQPQAPEQTQSGATVGSW